MIDSFATGAAPARRRRFLPSHLLARLFLVVVLVYLFAPVAVTVLFSFTTSPRLSLPIEGFTLNWYAIAFSDPLFPDALTHTLVLAVVTGIVAGALGVAFSFGLVRLQRRARGALLTASLVPAVVPGLVLGIALAVLFNALGVTQGLRNAAIGHIVIALPFVVLTMNARLETFDFTTLEAARDLGASPWRTFIDITLPLIRASVIGAVLLAMAQSLDEFVVTWFNIGNDMTLPVLIWGLLRRGISPTINALATVVLASLVVLTVLSSRVNRRLL
ncbi:MAG: ABC transporter permease [Chloroflexi bacterium]|nr:ABC transporter permease [Chloroflexota bacterium]